MAWDFLLDEDSNDLRLDRSEISTTSSKQQLLRQRMAITMKMWRGEWFWNALFGIPYRQVFFSRKIAKEQVDAVFLSVINSFDEVNYIDEFASEVNANDRSYSLYFHVYTDVGEDKFYVRLGGPIESIEYDASTIGDAVICPAGVLDIDLANAHYKLINIDIPTTINWT